MFFSAATLPGILESPNEDWVAISPATAVVLDGVTVPKDFQIGCVHGTPWYVNQLGTRLLAAAADREISLRSALKTAISGVASVHENICDLDQIGAPSAAAAVLRINEHVIEYLVLADITVLIKTMQGLIVVSDERVSATVDDLADKSDYSSAVMHRRERYRNKEEGYWVAASDPGAAEHAKVGQVPREGFQCAVMMSDGASRLVTHFEQTDWNGMLSLALKVGPVALIESVRKIEASDTERQRWPRFKTSDDATVAVINAETFASA